mgnify:CR=1 FL=1
MREKELITINMLQIKEEYLYMQETMTQHVCEMAQNKDILYWIWIQWIADRYIALNDFISAFIDYSEGDKAAEEIEWGIDRLRSSISYGEVIEEWNKWKEMTKNEQAKSAKKRKTTIERNMEWAENN